MTKNRPLRDILQEIQTYEESERFSLNWFESRKQKKIEELIFKVSNAYSYLCMIYPDFTEYNWNQDLGALLPNSDSISDLVENINSVAQEGKSFEKVLKLMKELYFVHNIQEDVTTNVNINDLLDRAQHMKEIAQNMVDEYETDAEIVLKELADIDKYKTGGVLEKIGIHLPKEYSGFIRTSAMARLLFNGTAPIHRKELEDYKQRIIKVISQHDDLNITAEDAAQTVLKWLVPEGALYSGEQLLITVNNYISAELKRGERLSTVAADVNHILYRSKDLGLQRRQAYF